MYTDSFILNFEGIDVYKEIKEGLFSKHIDLSNFSDNCNLYSDENKGQLGLLKSDAADIPIVEAICLAPKCYSILQDGGKVKILPKVLRKQWREIHVSIIKSVSVTNGPIVSKHNTLSTTSNEKRALTGLDKKMRVLHLFILG